MNSLGRRAFLRGSGAAAVAGLCPSAIRSNFARADDRFDLVIRGGEVVDPSQALRARRDVGIRWGRIAAISLASRQEFIWQLSEPS
jgi:dihydroorotase